jgi:hypothetical protein
MGDYGDVYMRKDAAGPPGRTKAQNRATVQQLKLVSETSLCRADATTLNLYMSCLLALCLGMIQSQSRRQRLDRHAHA